MSNDLRHLAAAVGSVGRRLDDYNADCGSLVLANLARLLAVYAVGLGHSDELSARRALESAADDVRGCRMSGLPEGFDSHPYSPSFEQWLRDRAQRASGGAVESPLSPWRP